MTNPGHVKTIKEMPVPVTIGQLLTIAPMVRAGLAYSMVIPREVKKKTKGKQTNILETSQVAAQPNCTHRNISLQRGRIIPEPVGDVVNFYTEGMVTFVAGDPCGRRIGGKHNR